MRKQRLNAGQMYKKAEIYEFKDGRLVLRKKIYVSVEEEHGKCVFSSLGRGGGGKITASFYKAAAFSPSELLYIDGQWYAAASVKTQQNTLYAEAVCGRCNKKTFLRRVFKITYDSYQRPQKKELEGVKFDGILCEKYISEADGEHFGTERAEKIMLFSKGTEIKSADIIEVDGADYVVRGLYEGDYFNEALLVREQDV